MAGLIAACAPYLPGGDTKYCVHKKAHTYFFLAADNLAYCAALTNEELKELVGNPYAKHDQWENVGTLDSNQYMELIINWSCMMDSARSDSSVSAEEEQQAREPSEGESDRPPKHTEKTTDIKTVVNSIEALIEKEVKSYSKDSEQDFPVEGFTGSARSPLLSRSSPEEQNTGMHSPKLTTKVCTAEKWGDLQSEPSHKSSVSSPQLDPHTEETVGAVPATTILPSTQFVPTQYNPVADVKSSLEEALFER
uniref:Uncharacterized protein n=1 Tax=Hubei toti-like virus 6 TaxID=1923317 RepID=A0A1L3KF53_9VIRU|nr:hypothetical protein 1 [Hubei toti-like virus 6]